MKIHWPRVICSCLLSFILVSYSTAGTKPIVFVSVLPQKFFVRQLVGDLVDVEVMVQPGASPATYEPKPSQMAKLASSGVYLAIGVPFERSWLGKFSAMNPDMKIVHTDEGIDKISMAEHLHDEEGGGEHGHEKPGRTVLDPHIWLSPVLVKKQVKVIADSLVQLLPEHGTEIVASYQHLVEEINKLDGELRELFRDKQNMTFMVFHPSWGYFAREYGLHQVAIEMEGKEPKPAQLLQIIRFAREHDIRVIFVQRQFSAKNARVVAAEIGGRVVTVDPLAENWSENLLEVAKNIHEGVR
ncbi:MAG: metal ABC transporter solute-binding protein, Zn/Mn family [Desulforhopalus sp.]